MKGSIKHQWNSIIHIGQRGHMDDTQEMRLITLNAFVVISSLFTVLFVVVFTLLGSHSALQGLFVLPILFLIIYCNYLGWHKAARVITIYFLLLVVLGLAIADRRTGTEYILIALGCCSVLVFENIVLIIVSFGAAFACYACYVWYDASHPFIPDPDTPYLIVQSSLMFLSGLAVVAQSLVFRHYVQKYAHDIKIANSEIGTINEELQATNEELLSFSENLESMVRQKSGELQAYIDAINVSIYSTISDLNGVFIEVNEQVMKTSGYSREELIGSHYSKLSSGRHPEEFFTERRNALMTGNSWRGEVEHKTKDGAFLWFDCVIIPMRESEGMIKHFLTLGLPVTERKQHEKMREEAREMLEVIAFRVSHKIHGPMATIEGLTMLLQQKLVSQDEFEMIAQKLAASNNDLKDATSELVRFVNNHPMNHI